MSATRFRRGYDLRLFLQRGVATSYAYRADGMRVKKILPGGDVTRSYYDGQMPVEEDSVVSGTSSVTRNFVGARGIESIFTMTISGTTAAFPLYDCHGNMVATVARNGAGFTTSNVRTYDAWGGVRTGATTGGPKGRYVANLGHVQDDESGLIYMRARFYEPESGRFISEDIGRDGNNWYSYGRNNPIKYVDANGKEAYDLSNALMRLAMIGVVGMAMAIGIMMVAAITPAETLEAIAIATVFVIAVGAAYGLLSNDPILIKGLVMIVDAYFAKMLIAIGAAARGGKVNGIGGAAVAFYTGYSLILIGLLAADLAEGMSFPNVLEPTSTY